MSEPLVDCTGVVETAIAAALRLAAEAQQWDIVVVLARELEARRVSRGGKGFPDGVPRCLNLDELLEEADAG